jgi:hypothetical protein
LVLRFAAEEAENNPGPGFQAGVFCTRANTWSTIHTEETGCKKSFASAM